MNEDEAVPKLPQANEVAPAVEVPLVPQPEVAADDTPSGPVVGLKAWLSDLKAYFQGAVDDAREAALEKKVAMFTEYQKKTGRFKE